MSKKVLFSKCGKLLFPALVSEAKFHTEIDDFKIVSIKGSLLLIVDSSTILLIFESIFNRPLSRSEKILEDRNCCSKLLLQLLLLSKLVRNILLLMSENGKTASVSSNCCG